MKDNCKGVIVIFLNAFVFVLWRNFDDISYLQSEKAILFGRRSFRIFLYRKDVSVAGKVRLEKV